MRIAPGRGPGSVMTRFGFGFGFPVVVVAGEPGFAVGASAPRSAIAASTAEAMARRVGTP